MVNSENLSMVKPGAILLNFSRGEIVDDESIVKGLNEGWLSKYISDFPIPALIGHVLSLLADQNVNVTDMLNKSRDDIAYNIIDVESEPSEALLAAIYEVEHVIKVRVV